MSEVITAAEARQKVEKATEDKLPKSALRDISRDHSGALRREVGEGIRQLRERDQIGRHRYPRSCLLEVVDPQGRRARVEMHPVLAEIHHALAEPIEDLDPPWSSGQRPDHQMGRDGDPSVPLVDTCAGAVEESQRFIVLT